MRKIKLSLANAPLGSAIDMQTLIKQSLGSGYASQAQCESTMHNERLMAGPVAGGNLRSRFATADIELQTKTRYTRVTGEFLADCAVFTVLAVVTLGKRLIVDLQK